MNPVVPDRTGQRDSCEFPDGMRSLSRPGIIYWTKHGHSVGVNDVLHPSATI